MTCGSNNTNKRLNRPILYPIFLECCQYTVDDFWKSVFENLAYGKCPTGTYIHKDFLSCNYKGKEFSYKIERKDSKEFYDDIYNLLQKVGILSKAEHEVKRQKFLNLGKYIRNPKDSWNNIRQKTIKDVLIERYVINMKHEHKLSLSQTKKLFSLIFIGLIFKVITANDIEYNEGEIKSIDGFDFINGKVILERDLYSKMELSSVNEIRQNQPKIEIIEHSGTLMSTEWDKFLTNLQKLRS